MNKHHNLPSIFVAMDFDSIDDAKNLALKIDPNKCGIKIGKEWEFVIIKNPIFFHK